MSIKLPSGIPGELRDPFHWHEEAAADGRVEAIEREEAAHSSVEKESQEPAISADDWRLRQIVNRLPKRVRQMVWFLRQPSRRWLRIPAGALLTLGGVFGFLPVLGFWMIPIGLALLADDVQILRSLRCRILEWVEDHRPEWIASSQRWSP
jgi:hypothetical protein